MNSSIREFSPRLVRFWLGLFSIASVLFVIYASLVPLHYVARPWDEVIQVFKAIPWLQLGIERRADWVANGLIMVPAGFFAAGAVDWQRNRRWPLIVAGPLIVACLVGVVVGIEFVQIWFPPRVVSQNDIFAGAIGSLVSVLMWCVTGNRLISQFSRFVSMQPSLQRWEILMTFGVIALLLYNLMPMDFVFSIDELRTKSQLNRLIVFPFSDFDFGIKSILVAGVATARVVPYAFIAALRRGPRWAIMAGIGWVTILEAAKIPVYSRAASMTDVVLGVLGVVVISRCAQPLFHVIKRLDRGLVWLMSTAVWCSIMLVGFLGRFDHIVRDPIEIRKRFDGILVAPFARAHSSSEFAAGENILIKLVVFGLLGFLLHGWYTRSEKSFKKWVLALCIASCLLMGIGIEVGQVFLIPLVPDVTDFILYSVGIAMGIVGFRLMIPATRSL